MKNKIIYPDGKRKSKKNITICIIGVLIIILVIVGLIIASSNKYIIKQSFSSIEKKLSYYTKFSSNNVLMMDEYNLKGVITPTFQIDSDDTLNTNFNIEKLNQTKINYEINKDKKDISTYYELNTDGQTIGSIKTILKDKINYLNLGDGWSKISQLDTINKDDLVYIKGLIDDSLNRNIKKEYYNSSNDSITINKEKKKVKKVSIILKNDEIYSVLNNILKDLKKDKKASEILKNNNINIDDIKLKKEDFDGYNITYSVYKTSTYGKYISYDLTLSDGINVVKLSYIADKNDEFKISYNDTNVILNITKKTNSVNMKLNVNEQEIATLKYESDKLENDLSLNIYFDSYYIDIVSTTKLQKQNKQYDLKGNSEISIKYEDKVVFDLNVENKSTLTKKASNITKPKEEKDKFDTYDLYNFINNMMNQYVTY